MAVAALGLLAALGLMLAVWLASLVYRDASLVDRFWGAGFVLLVWVYWLAAGGPSTGLIPVLAVTLWGGRLSLYLSWRNWGHGEDYRYQEMREAHGARFPLVSLGTVFLLQAVILWLVAMPLLPASGAESLTTGWLLLGLLLWAIGFLWEAIGDWQMARFKADPANRGQVMDQGLWRYSRHPNYFGEIVLWWGFYCMALAAGGWWTIFGPALMTFLLVRVSGVALLEKKLNETRPAYRDYIQRTNALLPAPPWRGSA
ncbi:DUF1295 domain-containing protein [Methylonatrum kenyense]|uniref:DUF1295 domain-containing protein n=1 Tax=Methylonatrum kenyense TaxID=455253 RepID=UPI0020BFA039|nr:DUF1295 domain-containing protein [Methylonatrum kenyense]MCK8515106.1 DUF1295 domain-containing protein [Methylonatrum kenyense]